MFKKYIDKYSIDENGILRNDITKKCYKGVVNNKGYLRVDISINGKRHALNLHTAVAKLFIPNPNNLPIINHIDGNKTNNYYKNLEWCTPKENMQHAVKYGLINTISQGGKKCLQKDLKGNIINIYDSISEASRAINGSNSNICRVCKGYRKQAYGYLWEYAK
jgi:hypothetical protein